MRISPDTGDGGREAGAGRDSNGGGEAEDPAEGRARTGHPGSGIDDAEANWAPFSFERIIYLAPKQTSVSYLALENLNFLI